MIKIQAIHIEKFRGIHTLDLELDGRNFAICGPNGTGKSGIVDAIEFALTGSVTRLTGQGTSGISVKAHAPHVDLREQPEKARVRLRGFLPALKREVSIERTAGSPATPRLVPDDRDVRAALEELSKHPEFALSRREIIRYVLTPPGERAKEVQALLRLDDVEKVRQALTTINNSWKGESKRFESARDQAQSNLLRGLGLATLRKEDLLRVVNERRKLLGLDELLDLQRDTSLKTGVALRPDASRPPKIGKKQATDEIGAFMRLTSSGESELVSEGRRNVRDILDRLVRDPQVLRSLQRQTFVRTGLDFVDDDRCPLCETHWEAEELRSLLRRKLDDAADASRLKRALEEASRPLATLCDELEALSNRLAGYAAIMRPGLGTSALDEWCGILRRRRGSFDTLDRLEWLRSEADHEWTQAPPGAVTLVGELSKWVDGMPDPSKEDAAKEFLTICQERLDAYRTAKRDAELAKKQTAVSEQVLAAYSESSTAVLTAVFKSVQEDFSRFYRFINRDDEETFQGRLTPSLGKLGFDVEFYGRGFHPPGAYHSEGHQDGMGLCLYLALMKHTLGEGFTFAVLDDVLMSVDAGHRREVCGLFKAEFPDTQFIVTTHDPIWLQHMKSVGLISSASAVQFRKWTIDDGPLVWNDREVWSEIEEELDKGDVPIAAGILRRFLEYTAGILATRLRVRGIEYRGDAQYDLGDLLPPVTAAWADLLKRARESARSWNKGDSEAVLTARIAEFATRVATSQVEQWAINKSIHYNEWASLRKEDFRPVVSAFRGLLEAMRCSKCEIYLYVVPSKGSHEELRCDCGDLTFNLKRKR